MILSGLKIAEEVRAGRIFISDFDEKRLNPNSYNLRLADEILIYDFQLLDMKRNNACTIRTIDGAYVPYTSGKYQMNHGVQPSMLWKDFQEGKRCMTNW